ncbi:MAG: dipeptide epimerase [Brevefilum sp.]|nr:dipeptide epimerase [Brevefilum sp.]
MSDKLSWQKITLQLRNPFRLSYGTSETREAFWIRLRDDEGWGEGTIPPYYGVDLEEMVSVWHSAANNPNPFPNDPQEIPAWIGDGPAPARCGLDIALHDRIARKLSLPLHKLLNVPFPKPKPSSFTIALDTPLEMARMAEQVKAYPIIKVKLGGDSQDLDRLAAIRDVRPGVKLWVDANGGWTLDEAQQYLPELEALGIEMLEQPLDKADITGMGILQSKTKIPIVADESLQSFENLKEIALAGIQGVNIKLMKVGGLSPALKMIHQAKSLDLKVMLGCMIETAIGTTAMAHLMGLGDWLDLDASALIVNDPFEGMTLDATCKVQLPEGIGLGVKIRDQDRFF